MVNNLSKSALDEIKQHIKETREILKDIRIKKNLEDRIVGGINFGTSFLRTKNILEINFTSNITGCTYSILTPRETMQKVAHINQEIKYKKIIVEHVCGFRSSNPNRIISELWIKIDAVPTILTGGIEDSISGREDCELGRSRLKWDGLGLKGILFQLSPFGTPQLYTFSEDLVYKKVISSIELLCEELHPVISHNKKVWTPTSKEPSPPWKTK